MKPFLLALALLAGFLLVGTLDGRIWGDPLSGRMPRAEVAEVALPLSHPLDCDATITTKVHYHERGKTRCYSANSKGTK